MVFLQKDTETEKNICYAMLTYISFVYKSSKMGQAFQNIWKETQISEIVLTN
jgi:hypothetical protein